MCHELFRSSRFRRILGAASILLSMTPAASADDLRVVPDVLPDGVAPGRMVENWMRAQVAESYAAWQDAFLRLQREGGWEAHNQRLRVAILEAIGGLPERTPLNARVTGEVVRPGFRVEKMLFESQPGFFVTASLYLPDPERFQPPYPGVLVPCGHDRKAKAHHEYQSMGALLALNGMVGLVFDPLDQSERMQYRLDSGELPWYGTHMHMQEGVAAILVGEGLIRTFLWDGIRALDYLESRPEVDPRRLAVTGNSGGGTQTSYLFALDERLKVAAPSCYVHLLNRQLWDSLGDAEQMIYGQLAIGLEHPSFYLMRAPAPVKILASTHDFFPIDAVWEGFRFLKRRYTDLGYSERVDILENNEGHNYDRTQREAAVRWIHLWLNGCLAEIREPELDLFSEDELRVTPTGQVLNLEGARSVFDLFRDKLEAVRPQRDADWSAMDGDARRAVVRATAGVRPLDAIPLPLVHEVGSLDVGDHTVNRRLLETEEGIFLPVVDFQPKGPSTGPTLVVLDPDGAGLSAEPGGILEQSVRKGRRVVGVDLRGSGETRSTRVEGQGAFFGTDQTDFYAAYVLGESYLGFRIEDVLRALRYAKGSSSEPDRPVELIAEGETGIPALHALFLDPDLVGHAVIRQSLQSWESILIRERSYQQLTSVVQGALLVYDLPFLESDLSDRLEVLLPVDSLGFVEVAEGEPVPEGYHDPVEPGLVGLFYGSPDFLNPQGEYPLDELSLHYDNAVDRLGNDWGGIWKGYLVGPVDGPVTIEGASDQIIQLSLDGEVLLSADRFPGRESIQIEMVAGEPVPIEVRFQLPSGGKGFLEIKWAWGGHPLEIIGRGSLRHSPAEEAEGRRAWR